MSNRSREIKLIHLNSCGISPTFPSAAKSEAAFALELSQRGTTARSLFSEALSLFKREAAILLATSSENISFVRNAAEGLNAIAHGLRLEAGDEIISYRYEYPSNHYPWLQQKRRGVKLLLLEGELLEGRPLSWQINELLSLITPRTKVITISHVQFTSGFAADLPLLGEICRERGIFLIVDAAQSLGALPLYPERLGIDAVVASGWKWLLGPVGSALLYTSPRLRAELEVVYSGPDIMIQGDDYLNYSWKPYGDGRFFEFSTLPYSLVHSLGVALKDGINRVGIEEVWRRIKRKGELIRSSLDPSLLTPIYHGEDHLSGITSCVLRENVDLDAVLHNLSLSGIVCSARGGYLRIAPHYWVSDEDLLHALERINQTISRLSTPIGVRNEVGAAL